MIVCLNCFECVQVKQQGFHLNHQVELSFQFISNLTLTNDEENFTQLFLIMKIPSGVFLDIHHAKNPLKLSSITDKSKLLDVLLLQQNFIFDSERMAPDSSFDSYYLIKLPPLIFSNDTMGIQSYQQSLSIPMTLRYHKPRDEGEKENEKGNEKGNKLSYQSIYISYPKLCVSTASADLDEIRQSYLRNDHIQNISILNGFEFFKKLKLVNACHLSNYSYNSDTGIELHVPVGYKSDKWIISVLNNLSTFLASIIIVFSLFRSIYYKSKLKKD